MFFKEWLEVNSILSDDDKEDAARNIAHDIQIALPYRHSDLDELATQHPGWRNHPDLESDDVYMHIQHSAGEAIFHELIDMWERD